MQYFPDNGQYIDVPGTIYAQFIGRCPNPCRKYHISASVESADVISKAILPVLAANDIFHKVVKSTGDLIRQSSGEQAGKFITIYMDAAVQQRNGVILDLGKKLLELGSSNQISPSPVVPKSRSYAHLFIEQPLDQGMFIYGGFVCDPTD